jgi:dTDP-4-dehydrorhamnose reductase
VVALFGKTMKWIVFGAGGQLGQSLTERLNSNYGKKNVRGYSRSDADITDFQRVKKLIQEFRPDWIVNAAAWTNVEAAEANRDLVHKVNTQGAINLANAVQAIGGTILQISTDYVFDGKFKDPIRAEAARNPVNVYGMSKSEAEIVIERDFLESSVILRTAWLYGHKGKNFARAIIKKALLNRESEIEVVVDQFGQPTSTLDLCARIIEMSEKNVSSGIFHGTNSGIASWFEFASCLLDSAGLDSAQLKPIKTRDLPLKVERPSYSVLGHQSWERVGLPPMRNWKLAIEEIAWKIRKEVELENGV